MSRLLQLDAELPPVLVPGTVVKAADLEILHGASDALKEARSRSSEVHDSLEAITEEARAKGMAAGLEEGRADAAILHWKTVLDTVSYLRGIQDSITGVVIDSLRKIILEIPSHDRVVQLVARSLQDLISAQRVVVSVHPGDAPAVIQAVAALEGMLPAENIEIRQRPDLTPGSCLLETPLGMVDASLESQLEALAESISAVKIHTP
jgi:type III secretion protein L